MKINYENATHWICTDNQYNENSLTIGKKYRIFYNKRQDEYYIINNRGEESVSFLILDGEYIIEDK